MIQLVLHSDAVHLVITQAEFTLFFEASFDRQNESSNQRFHPFHHDYELVTVLIHEVDVFLAEISSIKDGTNLTISIAFCLLQHLLELRDIDDASGILLIVKRFGVVMVIGDRVVQDRLSVVILRMPDLDTLQIACLAVLVGRIICDIDLFTVIMPVVPFILESDALVSRDSVNKLRDLRIAVKLHPLCKKRVIVGILRIVLTGVVFRNDGIRCQIRKRPASFHISCPMISSR